MNPRDTVYSYALIKVDLQVYHKAKLVDHCVFSGIFTVHIAAGVDYSSGESCEESESGEDDHVGGEGDGDVEYDLQTQSHH